MRILLTGKTGQLGWELQRSLVPLGEVHAVGRQDADFTNVEHLRGLVRSCRPAVIVNAAAYTAVDKAESEEALATAINATAPAVLAEEARRLGAAIINYSTDYVFDGKSQRPYLESDAPAPLNAYGRSKLAGEQAIASSGAAYLVFRTSWVYSQRGANFLRTMLRLGAEREQLSVVDDQIGAPTSARCLAEVTGQIMAMLKSSADGVASMAGIYNMTCAGQTSWFGFAQEIFERFSRGPRAPLHRLPMLKPVHTADYATAAIRPLCSTLSTQKLRDTFDIQMPEWKDAFRLLAADMLGED